MPVTLKQKATFKIKGRVISKKNSRIVTYKHGRQRSFPSGAHKVFEGSAMVQITQQRLPIAVEGVKFPLKPPYAINIVFNMRGQGATDGDNMQSTIWDLLQKSGIIEDDKHVIVWSGGKVLKQKEYEAVIDIQEV